MVAPVSSPNRKLSRSATSRPRRWRWAARSASPKARARVVGGVPVFCAGAGSGGKRRAPRRARRQQERTDEHGPRAAAGRARRTARACRTARRRGGGRAREGGLRLSASARACDSCSTMTVGRRRGDGARLLAQGQRQLRFARRPPAARLASACARLASPPASRAASCWRDRLRGGDAASSAMCIRCGRRVERGASARLFGDGCSGCRLCISLKAEDGLGGGRAASVSSARGGGEGAAAPQSRARLFGGGGFVGDVTTEEERDHSIGVPAPAAPSLRGADTGVPCAAAGRRAGGGPHAPGVDRWLGGAVTTSRARAGEGALTLSAARKPSMTPRRLRRRPGLFRARDGSPVRPPARRARPAQRGSAGGPSSACS